MLFFRISDQLLTVIQISTALTFVGNYQLNNVIGNGIGLALPCCFLPILANCIVHSPEISSKSVSLTNNYVRLVATKSV